MSRVVVAWYPRSAKASTAAISSRRAASGVTSPQACGSPPAERPFEKKTVPGGLLGADYEIANGRYRFAKVYGGLNWSPEARAPLTVPGVDAKAGEYLLAVRGVELKAPTEVYSLFENTSGKITEITVGPNPDGSGSRTVQVVPVATEGALRNRDWVILQADFSVVIEDWDSR